MNTDEGLGNKELENEELEDVIRTETNPELEEICRRFPGILANFELDTQDYEPGWRAEGARPLFMKDHMNHLANICLNRILKTIGEQNPGLGLKTDILSSDCIVGGYHFFVNAYNELTVNKKEDDTSYDTYPAVINVNGLRVVFNINLTVNSSEIQKRFSKRRIKHKLDPILQRFGDRVGFVAVFTKGAYQSIIDPEGNPHLNRHYNAFTRYGGLVASLHDDADILLMGYRKELDRAGIRIK